ncbi:MAG: hypothetical protein ABIS84_08765 [Arachnia sp.]
MERDVPEVPVRLHLRKVHGSITHLVMGEGLPVSFARPVASVAFLGDSLALVIFDDVDGAMNLAVLGPDGEELARLGTTTGDGTLSEVLEVGDEIRVIEATSHGDFQARLDLDSLTLVRVAQWR